ncbi:MAG: 4Fe-4S binding protein [Fibrobacteria bacterium]|nr:4Fe-4S binding protein [Fibrobacteria bacterium]
MATITEIFSFLLVPRIWVGLLFCIFGFFLLKTLKLQKPIRFKVLTLIFILFAIIPILPAGWFSTGMEMHPSPVCATTKPILFFMYKGFVPTIFILILSFIGITSFIGNKLYCGWTCPLGAIQELAHYIKLPTSWKIFLPFYATNTVRILVFIAFFPLAIYGGISLYTYFNPFEFFHWYFALYTSLVMLITLILSVFVFRPFCYILCPIGLLSWVIEQFSLHKLKVNTKKCNGCRICVKKANCPAVEAIVEGKKLRPDCHVCGRCVDLCPEKAFEFKR